MTEEITLQVAMSRTDSSNTVNRHDFPFLMKKLDQTLKRHYDQTHSIGTTEEEITFGDITSVGILLRVNLATANYVRWGVATTVYTGRMLFGEFAGPLRLETSKTIFAISDTAASDVRVILYGA